MLAELPSWEDSTGRPSQHVWSSGDEEARLPKHNEIVSLHLVLACHQETCRHLAQVGPCRTYYRGTERLDLPLQLRGALWGLTGQRGIGEARGGNKV